jgi:hypothetical protein
MYCTKHQLRASFANATLNLLLYITLVALAQGMCYFKVSLNDPAKGVQGNPNHHYRDPAKAEVEAHVLSQKGRSMVD